MIDRPSDEAIEASVSASLRALHQATPGPWTRQVIAQLIALTDYRRHRGPDRRAARRSALAAALDELAGNPLVAAGGSPEEVASAALVAAVACQPDDLHAEAVRAALWPLLVGELDAELSETMVLMDGFRGRVRDA
jgi:hypothetical protein